MVSKIIYAKMPPLVAYSLSDFSRPSFLYSLLQRTREMKIRIDYEPQY
jgi:hypothetical protein